ncbi:hypothetical protein HD554DRAFT_2204841 [Boletus coccyginus]|nr:hypothetical protein HD554DRAFT_2204841 [Boletus coccyginus]
MENVPLDLLYPVLDHLDRPDLVNTALVSSTFNRVATPLLYRAISSRISEEKVLLHPCTTLLRRPELAQYVRKVTETGSVQLLRRVNLQITEDITAALRLCTNLVSAKYVDDTDAPILNFLPILQVLVTLPLKELVIRTHHDVGEHAWALLNKIKGIRRLSVWSLNSGPPRVLQGWADELSSTLTHLEVGRCAGVPPTILISVFSKLPLLRDLKLKGVPSAAVPAIMGCLPNLVALDMEYLGSGNYRVPSTPLPALEHLTVRAGSVDILGPDRLWTWTRSLLPHVGSLESFTLHSFSVYGRVAIPWPFIVFLATKQGQSLEELIVGAVMLNLDSLSQLCLKCPALRTIHCTVASPDVESISKAISNGNTLRTLNLHVIWIEDGVARPLASDSSTNFSEHADESARRSLYVDYSHPASDRRNVDFTKEEARSMMLRPGSKLRAVKLGDSAYIGQWVLAGTESAQSNNDVVDGDMIFEVIRDITWSAL